VSHKLPQHNKGMASIKAVVWLTLYVSNCD
jgi:hypothetical protein